jgi:hypothetical protein
MSEIFTALFQISPNKPPYIRNSPVFPPKTLISFVPFPPECRKYQRLSPWTRSEMKELNSFKWMNLGEHGKMLTSPVLPRIDNYVTL